MFGTYDASHRRTSETNALGEVRTWTYDAQGNVLAETDFDGRVTSHTYDERGNPLTATGPDGAVTRFVHDLYARANPINFVDPSGQFSSTAEVSAASAITGTLSSTALPWNVTSSPAIHIINAGSGIARARQRSRRDDQWPLQGGADPPERPVAKHRG